MREHWDSGYQDMRKTLKHRKMAGEAT